MFGHAGRFLHLQPGIEYLRKDRHSPSASRRSRNLAKYWAELRTGGFWDELAGAVEFDGEMRDRRNHRQRRDSEPRIDADRSVGYASA